MLKLLGIAFLVATGLLGESVSLDCVGAAANPPLRFAYSSAPEEVVLRVESHSRSTGDSLSMQLFGDGRVELGVKPHNRSWISRRHIRVSPSEIESCLRRALEAGLAEWDDDAIRAEQRELSNGADFMIADGEIVRIELHLTEYQRGASAPHAVSKSIQVTSPDLSSRTFPSIPELRAATELRAWFEQLRTRPNVPKQ